MLVLLHYLQVIIQLFKNCMMNLLVTCQVWMKAKDILSRFLMICKKWINILCRKAMGLSIIHTFALEFQLQIQI